MKLGGVEVPAIKEIEKRIEELSGRYSAYEIFYDWITCGAISISNSFQMIRDKVWEQREKEYSTIIGKYTEEERKEFPEMLGLLTMALEEDMADVLGAIFMEMGMGSKATGQFFTPFHISELNARIAIDIERLKRDGEEVELVEPSCGGGGAIIAAAKYLKENGINYQKRMKVVAQDLDWKGVYMTYLQCSLTGIKAVVAQGDSLMEPYARGYPRYRTLVTPAAMGAFT